MARGAARSVRRAEKLAALVDVRDEAQVALDGEVARLARLPPARDAARPAALARLDEMTDLRSATASEGAAYVYIGVALAAVWGGAFVALQGKRILAGGSRADKVAA